jgi:hypothetical protein
MLDSSSLHAAEVPTVPEGMRDATDQPMEQDKSTQYSTAGA